MKLSSENHRLLDEENESLHVPCQTRAVNTFGCCPTYAIMLVALTLSIGLNLFQGVRSLSNAPSRVEVLQAERTRFAKLTWDTPRTFEIEDAYDSENETTRTQAWEAINYDPGSVALSSEYTASVGLPRAQPFPWDDSKGLYFLSAYHSLHCLKILYRTMIELRENRPLSFGLSHAWHCLDALRQDVICHADDTPMYSGFEHPGSPGVNQGRQCRDWRKLEAFAHDHTSCWRDINPTEPIDTILRYRYCPPGSPYNERIHAIFGDFDRGDNASATKP